MHIPRSRYVKSGGKLVVNAAALASLPLLGMSVAAECADGISVPAGANVTIAISSDKRLVESQALYVCPVVGADAHDPIATVDINTGNHPIVYPLAYSTGKVFKGSLLVLASSGIAADAVLTELIHPTKPDTPLPNPYPMSDHARALLDSLLLSETPFLAGEGLTVVVNRVSATEYLIAVSNPSLQQLPFQLVSNVGTAVAIAEIDLLDKNLGPSILANNLTGYCELQYICHIVSIVSIENAERIENCP